MFVWYNGGNMYTQELRKQRNPNILHTMTFFLIIVSINHWWNGPQETLFAYMVWAVGLAVTHGGMPFIIWHMWQTGDRKVQILYDLII